MRRKRKEHNMAVQLPPAMLSSLSRSRGMWFETPEEIEAGLEWGRRKRVLLKWIRRQLGRRLTRDERRCLELYYFQGLNFRQVGEETGIDAPAAFRSVRRSIIKLKQAAQEDPAWRPRRKWRRRHNTDE